MELELIHIPLGRKRLAWETLLRRAGLEPDAAVEKTALLWDGGTLAATGSRQGNLLKCLAVEEAYQGEGLTAAIVTALRQDAFAAGQDHLFLYTKPGNAMQFSSLFFYPIAKTDRVLLMENRKNGIGQFLDTLDIPHTGGIVGSAVMHCNPFTLGHRYLIETAAAECDWVYIFVLSEEGGDFPAAHRLELVRRGVADLKNVTVLPTGPYLISSATFPTYFLKDRDNVSDIHCRLDVEIFRQYFVPRFSITRRYVGTEPLSVLTDRYNQVLQSLLPASGIELREIPRITTGEEPISASRVRTLLSQGQTQALAQLVPPTTLEYLLSHSKESL